MAGRKGSTFPTSTPTASMFVFGLDIGEAVESLQNVKFLVSNFNPWTRDGTNGFVYPTTITDFVGFGTNTPLAQINSLSTIEQLRLSYDIDSFTSFTVSSIGNLTIAPTGDELILDSSGFLQTPAMPSFVGTVVDAVNLIQANTVYVVGKYAYVTGGSSDTLNIIDISEPTAPVIISSFTDALLDGANDVVVVDNLAYVTGGASTSIVIVDVSNPTTPTLKGSLVEATDLAGARHIVISGKYAYITATTNNSLVIVDVSDPITPFVVSVFTDVLLDAPRKLVVVGNYAYVISQSGSALLIVDISDPTTPTLTGSMVDATNFIFPQCVAVIGRYAYVGTLSNRVVVIDISNPTTPVIVGNLQDATDLNTVFSIQVTGNYAYVSCTGNGAITVVDIADPTAPFVVTSFSDVINIPQPRGMFVSGKYAYIASFSSTSFSVVDLHGTDIPTANIGVIETSDISVTNNAIINNNLYASGLNVGLRGIHTDGDLSVVGDLTVDTDTLFVDSTNDRVGINTILPLTELHVGSGTGVTNWFNEAAEDGLLIDTESAVARLAIQGTVQAELILHNTGGTVDQNMFRILSFGDETLFQIFSDDFVTLQRTMLTFDNSNGNVTLGGDLSVTGNIERSTIIGITASVTQIQGSEVLSADLNEVSIVASNNDTVTLPTAETGMSVTIINNGSKKLQIFPNTSDDLGEGVDTAISLSSGSTITFYSYDTTNWVIA